MKEVAMTYLDGRITILPDVCNGQPTMVKELPLKLSLWVRYFENVIGGRSSKALLLKNFKYR